MPRGNKSTPKQQTLQLGDPVLEERAAYRAELIESAGKYSKDVEALLKLRGSALYDSLYRLLLKMKLSEVSAEKTYRMRIAPEIGTFLRVIAEGTKQSSDDVLFEALLMLCTEYSGEKLWDVSELQKSLAQLKEEISEIKNSMNSILETVAITCYINPALGLKTEVTSKNIEKELEKIQLSKETEEE